MTPGSKRRPSEFELIERFFAPLSGKGSFALRDDAALLRAEAGSDLAITTDAIAEGVHFLPGTDPAMIARKAIRVNLSDLAAKGAEPFAILLSLGLADDWTPEWMEAFATGLGGDCRDWGIDLAGGDTWRSPGGTVVSVTALGRVKQGAYVSRLGAAAGDALFVTGTIGDAALGLDIAQAGKPGDDDAAWLMRRHECPDPRTAAAPLVARHASAAMDVSDGLAGDLAKLLAASGVSMRLAVANVPASAQALRFLAAGFRHDEPEALQKRLTGGDDYELLICVPGSREEAFTAEAAHLSFPVTRLGRLDPGDGTLTLVKPDGGTLEYGRLSWSHFGDEA